MIFGVRKYQVFDDGVELVLLNTKKGKEAWNEIKHLFRYEVCCSEDVYQSQKFDEIEIPQCYDNIITSCQWRRTWWNINEDKQWNI